MCTLIVLDVYVRSAKKSGEETRDLSLFPLKTFRVTKHLMSCARNRVFAFALLSFSLVFYALRFVLFYLFVLSFFVEEVMENEIAWKKRERGMIQRAPRLRNIVSAPQSTVHGCFGGSREFMRHLFAVGSLDKHIGEGVHPC